jgi:hypothetical protein
MLTGAKQNILELWKGHFYYLSSDLVIKKTTDRKLVDAIYTIIKDFWGEDFFIANPIDLIQTDTLHVVIGALRKNSLSAFYYLVETATLIDRAKSENSVAYHKLYAVRYRTDSFREILFEIYIEWILSHNKIPYQSEVVVGQQVKEGYCLINEVTYLIECKKKHSPVAQLRKLKQFISGEIFKLALKIKIGVEYICIINFKTSQPNQQQIPKAFKQFGKYVIDRGPNVINGVSLEYESICFEIVPFETATVSKLQDHLIKNDVFFICKNTYELAEDYLPKFIPGSGGLIGEEPHLKFKITTYFNNAINQEKILSKMINAVHKAKNQHAMDKTPSIIIIDNEFVEDFTAPLLNGNEYYEEKLQEYVDQHSSNAIIILLYRNFTQVAPSIKFSVICKAEQSPIKATLEKIDFCPIDVNKLVNQ